MSDPYFEINNDSIYSEEEYEQITEGKYGKPIFVPYDNNLTIDENELRSKIQDSNFFEYAIKSIKKTVKCEDALIRQILYTGLSTYVEDDPINLGVLAPTSEGKTYAVTETLQYFPDEDVVYIGKMSPMVLVRQKGFLIDRQSGEPLYEKIEELRTKSRELKKKKRATKDQDEKAEINEEIEKIDEDIRKLFENSKTLIDLRGKILVFLEPPKYELWEILKPILSHDKREIEFPFVDKTSNSNAETKYMVVRGWPACIFCSAKDESRWEIWNEIKSRLLVTSPNMIPKKYQESNKLISQSKGLPTLIKQQIIISNDEIEITKNCVLIIKQKINQLKSKNKNGKISLWIPYYDLLQKELPATKGTDVRLVKRIFSLLNVVPIVRYNLRKMLVLGSYYEEETSVIADLNDLKEVLSITQNFEGIPKYKIEFFNNILYPRYKAKNDNPDSSKDGTKKEDIVAVTARQLCDAFKKVKGKSITTDNLKKTFLDELISNGLIDYDKSNIDAKQYIYYPIVEPFSPTATSAEVSKNEKSLSLLSNSEQFDKVSQYSSTIYEKIIKNVTETWLFSEFMRLLQYRIDTNSIQGPLADFLNNSEEFKILDNSYQYIGNKSLEETDYSNSHKEDPSIDKNPCCCDDLDYRKNDGSDSRRLTIRQFTKRYIDISSFGFDNKRGSNIAPFGKISLIKSNLAKFDNKDIITKNKDEKISNTITQETQDSPSLISCNHCSYQGNSEYEVLRHSVNAHPGKPARPDPSLLELIIKEKNKKDEEEKRIKEEIRRWEEER